MPFQNSLARAFTMMSVRAHAPLAPGVYGISNAHDWLYIGQSDNIQGTLLNHLLQGDQSLMELLPTGFVFEVCEPHWHTARCARLIVEYKPVCNAC
jgi:hypothetical protein